jgi:hypothetical protein
MKQRRITIRVTEEMAQQIESARRSIDPGDRYGDLGGKGRRWRHRRAGEASASAVVQEALESYFRKPGKRGSSGN